MKSLAYSFSVIFELFLGKVLILAPIEPRRRVQRSQKPYLSCSSFENLMQNFLLKNYRLQAGRSIFDHRLFSLEYVIFHEHVLFQNQF